MEGGDRVIRRRKSLTERLGLKGIGCCGSTWGIMPPTTFNVVDDENDDVEVMSHHHIHTPPETPSATVCLAVGAGGSSGMNLAAALAAERHFRSDDSVDGISSSRPGPESNSGPLRPDEGDVPSNVPGTPTRMSLMRLLEETEVYEGELLMEEDGEAEGVGLGSDNVCCCVCMRRKKGAAFIPCGHTFCRVCSRELWVNRDESEVEILRCSRSLS